MRTENYAKLTAMATARMEYQYELAHGAGAGR